MWRKFCAFAAAQARYHAILAEAGLDVPRSVLRESKKSELYREN